MPITAIKGMVPVTANALNKLNEINKPITNPTKIAIFSCSKRDPSIELARRLNNPPTRKHTLE